MPSDLRSSPKLGKQDVEPRVLSQAWFTESFKAFGRHCARNQIRVLLIDSFVMTTLFYPALALHLQRRFPPVNDPASTTSALHSRINAKQHPLSLLSTPILDSVFPEPEPILPYPPSTLFWDVDRDDWEGKLLLSGSSERLRSGDPSGIVAVNVAWTSVRRGLSAPAFGALDLPGTEAEDESRLSEYEAQLDETAADWGDAYSSTGTGPTCIRNPYLPSACFATTTSDVSQTEISSNSTGVPLPLRVSTSVWNSKTYYFSGDLSSASATKAFRDDWLEAVNQLSSVWQAELQSMGSKRATRGEDWLVTPVIRGGNKEEPTIAKGPPSESSFAAVPLPIIFLYLCVIAYIMFCLTEAHQAHSRFGLAFTGAIELACSTIMSFSVMILFGWGSRGWNQVAELDEMIGRGAAGVPWYLLPFVVVVVGAENMSAVTKAVYAIPVTFSVPDRIGEALGKVGKGLFVTSMVDIIVLVIIRTVVTLRPVQDLCTFAAVLIFVDWWMLHTFYLTVLSIDCQRLDLADLIKQGSNPPDQLRKLAVNGNGAAKGHYEDASGRPVAGGFGRFGVVRTVKSVLRARSARGASSLMLLALLTVLYYVNESHQARALRMVPEVLKTVLPGSAPNIDLLEPRAATIWAALSKAGGSRGSGRALSVVSLAPNMVVIPSTSIAMTPTQLLTFIPPLRNRLAHRLKPLFYLFKVVLLPQGVTAFTLYLVLLFLLKDADHSEAQRDKGDKLGRKGRKLASTDASRGSLSPCQLLAVDLQIIRRHTIGRPDIRNHLVSDTGTTSITHSNNGEIILTTAAGSFSIIPLGSPWRSADVAPDGKHFVVASDEHVFLYEVDERGYAGVAMQAAIAQSNSTIAAVAIDAGSTPAVKTAIAIGRHNGGFDGVHPIPAGTVSSEGIHRVYHLGGPDTRFARLKRSDGGGNIVLLAIDDEGNVLLRSQADSTAARLLRQQRTLLQKVTAVDFCDCGGSRQVAIGTSAGSLEIWDVETGTRILEVDTADEQQQVTDMRIRRVQLVSPSQVLCRRCGQSQKGNMSLVWSSAEAVGVMAVAAASTPGQCLCILGGRTGGSPRSSSDAFLSPNRGNGTRPTARRRSSALRLSPGSQARETIPGESPPKTPCTASESAQLDMISRRSWPMTRGAWTMLPGSETVLVLRRSERTTAKWQAVFVDIQAGSDWRDAESIVDVQLEVPSRSSSEPLRSVPIQSLAEKRERISLDWERRPKKGEPIIVRQEADYPPLAFYRITKVVAVGPQRVDVVAGNMVVELRLPSLESVVIPSTSPPSPPTPPIYGNAQPRLMTPRR